MTKEMDAPFLEDAKGRRRQTNRTTRHVVHSHLHTACLDEDALDSAVLPVPAHDVGRKVSPKPKEVPEHPRRGGFKVWKTAFWKRRRQLWAERNAAARALAHSD